MLLKVGLVILVLVGFLVVPNFKINKGVEGFTLTTPTSVFYLASMNPVKVYKFDSKPKELSELVKSLTDRYPVTFGIYIKNLTTGQEITVNADEKFEAASLYKLGVMYTIYKKASEGKLDLENSDIKNNLERMITVSSNEAAYYLVDNYTSWAEVTRNLKNLGLKNTTLNQDPIITTPKDIGRLLEAISSGEAVNLEASISMLKLMSSQEINDRIPVHLPPEVLVAHKTGDLDGNIHDAGVVIGPDNNYVLVIMSKDSGNLSIKPVMANLSLEVFNFFKNQWSHPPEIL